MFLSKTFYPLLSTGSNQEDRKASQHDRQIVDWDAKHQHKQIKIYPLENSLDPDQPASKEAS